MPVRAIGSVPADAEYARSLLGTWHHTVYPVVVQLIFPAAGRGRPRVRYVPGDKAWLVGDHRSNLHAYALIKALACAIKAR